MYDGKTLREYKEQRIMKKPASKTTSPRQLVLRRETITELTPRQLEKVVGGWTLGEECVSQAKMCADNPI